ncbi:hypothetical protein [Streptomyces sp. NBC_00258]|uniref:hypothetical protein n=1 Tax=Streptomyces sp. NBC_00258 TaxID=2903642 RepID=UPI002E2ADDB3|nr:hypothetical protein [Streptomyces sp. NBC_00258]
MERKESYGQHPVMASVLAARVVYLIGENSADGFRRAVCEASTRWAGITEPIVPVPGEGVSEAWQEMIKAADVQGAVNVDLDECEAEEAARQLGLPLVALSRIDDEGAGRFTCHPASVAGPVQWDQSYLIAQAGAPLWQVAAAGDVAAAALHDLQKVLPVSRPLSDVEVATAQLHSRTLLEQGRSQFREHSAEGHALVGGPMTIVVTDPDDVSQLALFWTLRALRPLGINPTSVVLVPRHGVEHWVRFADDVARHLREHPDSSPDVALYGPGLPDGELHALAVTLQLAPGAAEEIKTTMWAQRDPSRDLTYTVDADPRLWLVFDRSWGQWTNVDAHFYAGPTSIEFSSPVRFTRPGQTLVRLSSTAFDGLPRRPRSAEMVVRNAVWHQDSIQISTHAQNRYQLTLTIPELPAVVEHLLTDTVTWELSDKGRLGAALSAQTDPAALLEPHLYESVVALTTRRTEHFLKALAKLEHQGHELPAGVEELATEWGSRMERRYAPARQLQGLAGRDALPALERACALGWAERGIAIDCQQCRVKSFIPLASVGPEARCPGCASPSAFRATDTGVDLHYRLDSFLDRASDQGVLPHLMAIAALQQLQPASYFLPGANLVFSASERAEVDLYGTFGGRVLAGELKTRASEFHEEQTARDIELSARLGADIHLMAAVDALPDSTVDHARQLCADRGMELLVLDQEQLRPAALR